MIPSLDLHRNRKPRHISDEEWAVRVELAACYRLAAKFGMTDLTHTHISVRVPGRHDQFLLNPHGWLFEEVTASSLVKIDVEGNPIDETRFIANKAGFVIHSALHMGRPDIECVVHLHTTAGMAVSALECGILPLNQINMQFYNRVNFHEYEGISFDVDERERIVKSMGDKDFLILRNHGTLTVGPTVPEAFVRMYYMDRACEIQVQTLSMGHKYTLPPPEVCEHAAQQHEKLALKDNVHLHRRWHAMLRMLEQDGADYIC